MDKQSCSQTDSLESLSCVRYDRMGDFIGLTTIVMVFSRTPRRRLPLLRNRKTVYGTGSFVPLYGALIVGLQHFYVILTRSTVEWKTTINNCQD